MRYRAILVAGLFSLCFAGTTPRYGIQEHRPDYTVLTNARIVTEPGTVIEKGNIVFRDGEILDVGKTGLPAGAKVVDMKGRWIYPGFIDMGARPEGDKSETAFGRRRDRGPVYETERSGDEHWNPAIHPDFSVRNELELSDKAEKFYIENGYTTVHFLPEDGIFQGQGAVLDLGVKPVSEGLADARTPQVLSFSRGSSELDYPSSLMGSIALIRQTFMDADWYRKCQDISRDHPDVAMPEANAALDALGRALQSGEKFCFRAGDELDVFRIRDLVNEFGLSAMILGSNYEYRRLNDILALHLPFILPLKLPDAPEYPAGTPAENMDFETLKHWDSAPFNAGLMAKGKGTIAFTTEGLTPADKVPDILRRLMERGLNEEDALAALTTVPAELLGLSGSYGKIKKGYRANFTVFSGDLKDPESMILSVYVRGREHELRNPLLDELTGLWTAEGGDLAIQFDFRKAPRGKVYVNGDTLDARDLSVLRNVVSGVYGKTDSALTSFRFLTDGTRLDGTTQQGSARAGSWNLSRRSREGFADKKKKKAPAAESLLPVFYPDNAFGFETRPAAATSLLLKNAEIWTLKPGDGVLRGEDMLVVNGRISKIGPNLSASGATVLDLTGKIVTPGIIDAHAHVAIDGGVNEGTTAITAEARIGDVIDSDDINIYRQLAGGVTAIMTLHGSANPIGALNQVIKMKWGALPDEMKIANPTHATIKFALGENVKQSNWGDAYVTRFPQTRMGVEALIRDALIQAQDYARRQAEYKALSGREKRSVLPPRRDLQMEHLAEVLDGKIKIHCHSYVQTEIQMMTRISKEFNLPGGTFVHVLEGYKAADDIREAGWMATTFSDWWDYKFEVYDAIPYNAAMMYQEGIVVSLNSDDYELGRRLYHEVPKAMKYGGVPREDAFRMITLNSARQLYIDGRTGSLETGKDADFVVWNTDPTHADARVLQTWIEGVRYFDIDRDQELRQRRDTLKSELIDRYYRAGKSGRSGHGNGGAK